MTCGGRRASSAPVHLALAALAACAGCPCADGAQWSVEPQLGLLVDYNSNLLLSPSGAQASEGTTLDLDTTLKRVTDDTEMDLHPHLELQRFASDAALNADNDSLQGAFSQLGERSSISLTGSYERVSTLTTELSDTGIIDTSTHRETGNISVTLGHDITERQHLDLQGSYTDVIYPGGELVGLIGYRYPVVSLTDTFTLSPLTSVAAAVQTDQLKAPISGYEAHDNGVRFGVTHKFSTRTKLSATAGITQTTVSNSAQNFTQNSTQYGYVWELHATHNSELRQWDFDYSRTLTASGRGYLVRRDAVNLTVAQNVAPRLYATFTLQDIHNTDLYSGVFQDVPRYISSDGGFDWHLSEHVVLSFTAGLAEIHEPISYQLARGWHTALTTRWTPVPLSTSR